MSEKFQDNYITRGEDFGNHVRAKLMIGKLRERIVPSRHNDFVSNFKLGSEQVACVGIMFHVILGL